MAEIELTQGFVALVNDERYDYISQFTWSIAYQGQQYYAHGSVGGKVTKMHHLILPPKPGFIVDHIDRNGLNNYDDNLRYATRGLNRHNSVKMGNATSEYIGVSWASDRSKWRAQTTFERKHIHIGDFKTAIEAALAYDEKMLELWGELARTNESLGLIPYE